jgi:hypothetical protein
VHTDYFEDIRTLYHECLQAVRDGDSPESWQRRLHRIQELRILLKVPSGANHPGQAPSTVLATRD